MTHCGRAQLRRRLAVGLQHVWLHVWDDLPVCGRACAAYEGQDSTFWVAGVYLWCMRLVISTVKLLGG